MTEAHFKTGLELLERPEKSETECPFFGGWIGQETDEAGLCTALSMPVLIPGMRAYKVCRVNGACQHKPKVMPE